MCPVFKQRLAKGKNMNKIIVVIFDDERAAELGTRALKDLDSDGTISLYAMGVIAKDHDGKVSVKHAMDKLPGMMNSGAGMGLVVGSFIGLLSGPVGLAVGAVAGTMIGALRDFLVTGVGIDFIEEANGFLHAGKVALIAEIEEDWIIPVDSRMENLGGVVFRRARADVLQAHFDHDVSVVKAEIADLEEEYKRASGDAKEKLHSKITSAKTSLDHALQQSKQKISELEADSNAKIKLVETQLSTATGEMKASIEGRLKKMRRASHDRSAKLKQAWALTKDAFAN
jgi:uncharacterized membrane protein